MQSAAIGAIPNKEDPTVWHVFTLMLTSTRKPTMLMNELNQGTMRDGLIGPAALADCKFCIALVAHNVLQLFPNSMAFSSCTGMDQYMGSMPDSAGLFPGKTRSYNERSRAS